LGMQRRVAHQKACRKESGRSERSRHQ